MWFERGCSKTESLASPVFFSPLPPLLQLPLPHPFQRGLFNHTRDGFHVNTKSLSSHQPHCFVFTVSFSTDKNTQRTDTRTPAPCRRQRRRHSLPPAAKSTAPWRSRSSPPRSTPAPVIECTREGRTGKRKGEDVRSSGKNTRRCVIAGSLWCNSIIGRRSCRFRTSFSFPHLHKRETRHRSIGTNVSSSCWRWIPSDYTQAALAAAQALPISGEVIPPHKPDNDVHTRVARVGKQPRTG